jgi:putative transposase
VKHRTTAYRFRLYPDGKQFSILMVWLELCRRLYNQTLGARIEHYKATKRGLTYTDQQNMLPAHKTLHQEYQQIHSQVLQDVLRRVDHAYKNFFEHRTHYPRFKKYGRYRSLTFPQITEANIGTNSVVVPKVGRIRMVKHRPIRGKPKTLTILRYPDGDWYATITVERKTRIGASHAEQIRNPVGCDSGLLNYLYLSNGEHIGNPHFIKRHEKRIIKAQRRLSRKVKVERTVTVNGEARKVKRWSNNWHKAKTLLGKRWQKYDNTKADWQWRQADQLTIKHDFIAYEDLPIQNMLKNHNLAAAISDAAWGGFWRKVEHKAVMADSITVRVPLQYTTQTCSRCGCRNKIALSERTYRCRNCGLIMPRDHNSSRVILAKAFSIVGMDMPEFTPVETEPTPPDQMMEASPIVETGNKFPNRRRNSMRRGRITVGEAHSLQAWEDVTIR